MPKEQVVICNSFQEHNGRDISCWLSGVAARLSSDMLSDTEKRTLDFLVVAFASPVLVLFCEVDFL
jgi:hypothetical protein